MQSKKARNMFKKINLLTLLLSFLIIFACLNNNISSEISNTNSENTNNLLLPNYSSSSEYSGIGEHQNVTEYGYGYFDENKNLNITSYENATIRVPENWEATEILVNVTNIYEYNKLWMNETFDTDVGDPPWSNNTSPGYLDNIDFGWTNYATPNNSIYINHTGDGLGDWNSVETYWNYTFSLDRENIPFKYWELEFRYKMKSDNDLEWFDTNAPGPAALLCSIYIDDSSTPSAELALEKLRNYEYSGDWETSTIAPFTPELFDIDYPCNISITFGVAFKTGFTVAPTGYLEVFFDNITLNIPSTPKPSQIELNITDNSPGGLEQPLEDIDSSHGLGTASFEGSWLGIGATTEYEFSFTSNSTNDIIIDTEFFVNATSLSNTTTEQEAAGSSFTVRNETVVEWTMFFSVIKPWDYNRFDNYYISVSKPSNWNVTHLIDPLGKDRILNVTETSGIGNTTLIIHNNITNTGRWKIVAESPNYVLNATIWKWATSTSTWEKNASFEISDIIKINATIDNSSIPDLTQTNASLLIYYPNGTLWSEATQELSVDSSGNVEFSNFTLGANNATAGKYTMNVHWDDKNIIQVGLFVLNFDVSHDTALNRANDQDALVTPVYTGDTVLIKVNYTDIDARIGIIGANINYTIDNETIISGDMVYFGGGIYVAEIDSSGLKNGIYNVSISANKTYYKTQYKQKLIQLEIVERTSLSSPQMGGVDAPWGSNVSIDVFYNDYFNQGISNAFINCDWTLSSFTVQPGIPGQYKIILNTSIPQFGTYLLEINASKDGYENQKIFISINIRNIYTKLTFIQPDPVEFLSSISIQVEYGDVDHNILIPGASITISSQPGSQHWNSNDFLSEEISFGSYRITFNSSLLGCGTYGIYVTANKINYANATTLINVFIGDITTILDDIFINGQNKTLDKSIIIPIQSTVNISVKYIEAVTDSNIKNATVEILGGSFSDNFTKLPNEYKISIDTRELGMGVKILTILAKKYGYTLASSDITIIVGSINTTIDTESGGNLIEITRGEPYTLKIVLKNEDFGGNIKNATVRYSWEFGHDELRDFDNNGVYDVNFSNIPEGNFVIIITASAGYEYNFEPFEITLIVSSAEVGSGLDLSWLVYVLIGSIVGLVSIFTLYQTHFKYPPLVRRIRNLKKKVKKAKKTKPIVVDKREDIINTDFEDYKKILISKIAPIEKIEKLPINKEEEI